MDCVQNGFVIYMLKFMRVDIPSISKQLSEDQVFQSINKNFAQLNNHWFNFQMEWLRGAYSSFKDQDKYLIIIYLVNKTMNFFSRSFIVLDYDSYYLKSKIEISNFNIINISKDLLITKETARRKVLELEKLGVLKRDKKKIILDRNKLEFQKPGRSIESISIFLSKFSETLYEDGFIGKKYSKEVFQNYIRKNFTHCWKLFYEMQIPLILGWKKAFGDFETWHIWAIIVTQNSFKRSNNFDSKTDREKYIIDLFSKSGIGINAMSISELSGIPRATVVRKINNLLKKKLIIVDNKKLYHPGKIEIKKYADINKNAMHLLSAFTCKIINLIQVN